jgi:hypothetical protein
MSDFRDASRRPRPPTAVGRALGAKSSGAVSVSVGGEVVTAQAPRDLTLAADDPVLIQKNGSQWFVVQRYGVSAPVPPDIDVPPAPRPPNPVSGTLVVPTVATRSYRPNYGWRTDNSDVYQGQYGGFGNHTGCAFYGSKPRSLAGATVTSATIRVRRIQGGNFAKQTTTLWLVTESTKPSSSAPTRTSSTTGPRLAVGGTDNSFTIPTSWAQAMVDGTAGGLAIFDSNGSPYVVLAGRGTWSSAFVMTIRWTR